MRRHRLAHLAEDVKDRPFLLIVGEFGGVTEVDRQALQMGQRVPGPDQAEVERARIADAGDVQSGAVEQQRDRVDRVEA